MPVPVPVPVPVPACIGRTQSEASYCQTLMASVAVQNVSVSTESGGGSDDEDKSSKMETLSSSVPDTIENAVRTTSLAPRSSTGHSFSARSAGLLMRALFAL